MNKMKEVAKLLGVELGEEFCIGNDIYRITETGLHYYDIEHKKWRKDYTGLTMLLNGRAKIKWQPKNGEEYYYPHFGYSDGVDFSGWENDKFDNKTKNNVGIYKTKEQAQEKARELGWLE